MFIKPSTHIHSTIYEYNISDPLGLYNSSQITTISARIAIAVYRQESSKVPRPTPCYSCTHSVWSEFLLCGLSIKSPGQPETSVFHPFFLTCSRRKVCRHRDCQNIAAQLGDGHTTMAIDECTAGNMVRRDGSRL